MRSVKVSVPGMPADYLHRPRLLKPLADAGEHEIILVSAPAGYGKTLLLADWCAGDHARTAWVTLDEDDNDDARFWASVIAALRACPAVPAGSSLDRLAVDRLALPVNPSRAPDFLAGFVSAIAELPAPIRLVFDDVHELTAADPIHGLAYLLRDCPDSVQLVLATRSDAPLHLERLRLAGRLCELHSPELAFTFEETAALLARAEVRVQDEQVKLLLAQTDGWVAGLRLAAVSLREAAAGADTTADTTETDAFLRDLVGNSRGISEYLATEVLAPFPVEVRELLLAVSICEDLTAPLAIALSGREEAGEWLLEIERQTSLVVSHGEGRRMLKIHPLLRAHLRADLSRRRPDQASVFHGRAARWFEAEHEQVLALRHAGACADADLMTDLLHRHGLVMATSGHHDAVAEALQTVASRRKGIDPYLELLGALARLEVGDGSAVSRHIARAKAAWPTDPTPELESLRALAHARRVWITDEQAAESIGRIGALAEGSTDDQVGMMLQASAAIAMGRYSEAETLARAATSRALHDGNAYLAARGMTSLSMAAGMRGDINEMVDLAFQAEQAAPAERWKSTEGAALNAVMRAYGMLVQSRPDECLRLAEGVTGFAVGLHFEHSAPSGDPLLPMVQMLCAAARFDLGGGLGAFEALRAARLATPTDMSLLHPAAIGALIEHGAAIQLGRADHVRSLLAWAEERLGSTGDVHFLRAAGPALISRHQAARKHLEPLLDGSAPPVVQWALVEGWLLECEIQLEIGSRPRARDALTHGLQAAHDIGVTRPLTYASSEVATLLAEQLGGLGSLEGTARAALAIHRSRERMPLLTVREQAVLALLPTQRSLDEIAEDLAVSVNTVKSHVKAVYGKLGVNSRRGAVGLAQRHGLFDGMADRRGPN